MNKYQNLKRRIEAKFGAEISSVKELKMLKKHIETSIDKELSYNTLRRFYDFLPSTKTSISTLDKLSRYIGYIDYFHFSHLKDFSDWETWITVTRMKQYHDLSSDDIDYLVKLSGHNQYALYIIDLLNHFILQQNEAVIKKIFSLPFDIIDRVDYLRISVSIGILIRSLYKNDLDFLKRLLTIDNFRRVVVYNFIDYSYLNFGYLKLLQESKLIEMEKEHQLFLSLILPYADFLNGSFFKQNEFLYTSEDYINTYPIVKGRFFAFQYISTTREQHAQVFKEMCTYATFENKCEFFFEVIPSLILLKRLDFIAQIFKKYHTDIFEINNYNHLTHQGIFQVGLALMYIKKNKMKKASKELESIKFNLIFDSYFNYIRLFYLIASYHIESQIDKKNELKNEYLQVAKQTKLSRFNANFLENYFSNE